jgi:hypothetical protein
MQRRSVLNIVRGIAILVVTNVASCYSKIFVTKQQNKLPNLNEMQRSLRI